MTEEVKKFIGFASIIIFAIVSISLTIYLKNEENHNRMKALYREDKEQFRATWVSTVDNLNFSKADTKQEFIKEYDKILDTVEEYNLNTIIFQVRPMLDAWYISKINPTSKYITGEQGAKLNYDPLKIAIEMTHERGMEFHAWLNPYRVTNNIYDKSNKNEKLNKLHINNFARKNPDAVYEFNNALYLDPGNPKVLKYMEDTIEEIINNYEVDAIHFDDYFYPYTAATKDGATISFKEISPDKDTFKRYSRGFKSIDDWRFDNINLLIKTVKETISKYNEINKESIQFGISPFGIWGHKDKIKGGSNTPIYSTASMDDYVDSRKWVESEWVDYIIPQIYWAIGSKAAPYGELVKWWNSICEKELDSHLYIGQGIYKYDAQSYDSDWQNPSEVKNQLELNDKLNNIKGYSLFSVGNLYNSDNEVRNKALNEIKGASKYRTLTPSKSWLDYYDTKPIKKLKGETIGKDVSLRWIDKNKDSKFYVIYRTEKDVLKETKENILDIIPCSKDKEGVGHYVDKTAKSNTKYIYAVSVIDKANIETDAKKVKILN